MAATPELRWRANAGASPWFAEAGIGATFTTNLHQTDQKRFSTRFNFGDHLAIGHPDGSKPPPVCDHVFGCQSRAR